MRYSCCPLIASDVYKRQTQACEKAGTGTIKTTPKCTRAHTCLVYTSIDNNLKALQEAGGGTIAAVYPFADPVAIICNDDGKLMGLPLNLSLIHI